MNNLSESLGIPSESDYEIIIEEYKIPVIQNIDDRVVTDYLVSGTSQALYLTS